MEQTHRIDEPNLDPAVRRVMQINEVMYCIERDGRFFIDKLKPRTRNEYVTLEMPREVLDRIRHRVSVGEPLQDFEGLLSLPAHRSKQRGAGKRRGK